MSPEQESGHGVEGLFALAAQLEERLAKARGPVVALTPCESATANEARPVHPETVLLVFRDEVDRTKRVANVTKL